MIPRVAYLATASLLGLSESSFEAAPRLTRSAAPQDEVCEVASSPKTERLGRPNLKFRLEDSTLQ